LSKVHSVKERKVKPNPTKSENVSVPGKQEVETNSIESHKLKFPIIMEYNVLLIRTAIKNPIDDEDFGVPMGLYVLKDYLKTTGHNLVVDIWDERLEIKKTLSEIGDKLKEYKNEDKLFKNFFNNNKIYDAVGISMCSSEVIPALKKFKIVKEKNKDTVTFCGGIFTTSNEKCLLDIKLQRIGFEGENLHDKRLIDYVIPGIATKPLGDLLARLYQKKYLRIKTNPTVFDIYGVANKDNIKSFRTPWFSSELPTMQLSIWSEITEHYKGYLRKIGIYTARGCNRVCSFCSVQKESNQNIYRRIENSVIDEINYLKEQGFKYFSFKDEDFLFDGGFRMRNILNQVKDTGVNFKIRARYDEVNKKDSNAFLKELQDIGIDEIQYGIETHDKSIRKSVDKMYNDIDTKKDIEAFIKKHAEYGITANCSFILGMEGESVEYYDDFIGFMENIYNGNKPKPKIYLNYLTPHPCNSKFELREGTYHLVANDLNYFTHRYPVCYKGPSNQNSMIRNEKMLETHDKIAEITNSKEYNPSLDDEELKENFIGCKNIASRELNLQTMLKRGLR